MRSPIMLPQFDEEKLVDQQITGIRWTLGQALNSPQYRAKFDGINPNDIRSFDDVRKLPFTTVEDLREGYPMPLCCVPCVIRHHGQTQDPLLHPQGCGDLQPANGALLHAGGADPP